MASKNKASKPKAAKGKITPPAKKAVGPKPVAKSLPAPAAKAAPREKATPVARPVSKPAPAPMAKAKAASAPKPVSKPTPKAAPKPAPKPVSMPGPKTLPKPDPEPRPEPRAEAKPKADPTPRGRNTSASAPKGVPLPSAEQGKKAAERLVGALIRTLLSSRRRNYLEGIKVEKVYYAPALFEDSRKTYTRYLDAEQKERILKLEPAGGAIVHVYTSGEGMGKNRYTCSYEKKQWLISAIDVMCGECNSVGACRWCEGKGCIDCQQTGRCVACSGTGWAKWAK